MRALRRQCQLAVHLPPRTHVALIEPIQTFADPLRGRWIDPWTAVFSELTRVAMLFLLLTGKG